MILLPKNRKAVNFIRCYAKSSVKQSLAREDWRKGIPYLIDHYFFDLPLWRNLWIARYLSRKIAYGNKILDWGCGYGDISFLLQNARPDLKIILYDILSSPPWEKLVRSVSLQKIIGSHQSQIPFKDSSFDVIVAAGVLEHVRFPNKSLRELYRVLRPGGKLFIFLYPNRFSYTEHFQRLICHPHHKAPLSLAQLRSLIQRHGFLIQKSSYQYMLPFVLSRFSLKIRRIYNFFGNLVVAINWALEKIPFLSRISSNLMVVAQKPQEPLLRKDYSSTDPSG